MSNEPRPRVRDRKTLAVLVILAIGVIGLALVLWRQPAATIEGEIPSSAGRVKLDLKSGSWTFGLGIGVFMALTTVSAYELLSLGIQWGLWKTRDRYAFDAFFGEDASDRCGEGVIILQADKIEALLEEYRLGDIREEIDSHPANRLYKAREWLNEQDTQGAREIIAAFRGLGLDAPMLETRGREKPKDQTPSSKYLESPFVITMGLAFSEETDSLVNKLCRSWMRIGKMEKYGDVVEFLHNLVPETLTRLAHKEGKSADFRSLIPRIWDLQKWLGRDASVRDYAILLRHTETDGKRRVKFVVAGFTERGTAAAGKYLAKNWRNLWREYVKGRHAADSFGDFVLVIEGPSYWQDIREWDLDPYLTITPEKLLKATPHLVDTVWVQRMQRKSL
jgi:hypothetical protein